MSNILKTEAAQTKLSAAQTSTNEAQTNETIVGNVEHVGGWVTSETATKYYFNILKTEAAQTIFFTAQTEHKRLSLFWVNLEHVGGLVTSSPIIQCLIF